MEAIPLLIPQYHIWHLIFYIMLFLWVWPAICFRSVMMTPSAPITPLFTSSLTSHTNCTHINNIVNNHLILPVKVSCNYLCRLCKSLYLPVFWGHPAVWETSPSVSGWSLPGLHSSHLCLPVSGLYNTVATQPHTEFYYDVTKMTVITADEVVTHPLGLGRLCEDQGEEAQTHFFMLLLTFTHLQD